MDQFKDVSHFPLQTFNRVQMALNIREDAGVAPCEEYIQQFPRADREAMAEMLGYINKFGYKKAKELVTEGVKFPEYCTDV